MYSIEYVNDMHGRHAITSLNKLESRYNGCMSFDEKIITEFISAYEEAHGEKLSPEEATVMFGRLVRLYKVLLRPLPPSHDDEPTLPS